MIAWYVHDAGSGHGRRLAAVAPHLRSAVTAFGAGAPVPGVRWVALDGADRYARAGEVGAWLRRQGCDLLVLDAPFEDAPLPEQSGASVVLIDSPAERDAQAHRRALAGAVSLVLLPWPTTPGDEDPLPGRTVRTGSFGVQDLRAGRGGDWDGEPVLCSAAPGERCVLLLMGTGRHALTGTAVAEAAAAGGWHWHVAGPLPGAAGHVDAQHRGRTTLHGWVEDPWRLLRHADVVVGPSGDAVVADVAAARRPFLALPQDRPHGQHRARARLLSEHGLAIVRDRWPDPGEWPGLLAALTERDGDAWTRWADGAGARRCAAALDAAHDSPSVVGEDLAAAAATAAAAVPGPQWTVDVAQGATSRPTIDLADWGSQRARAGR
jgi:UDP-N-acetylglucosamine--N-acetylmuramyl-(pentapeptide) pyrophosphoryl-undecaprenol N-acetylglucosamine transferase